MTIPLKLAPCSFESPNLAAQKRYDAFCYAYLQAVDRIDGERPVQLTEAAAAEQCLGGGDVLGRRKSIFPA